METRVLQTHEADQQSDAPVERRHCCGVCEQVFSSRNKLFAHLEQFGHTQAGHADDKALGPTVSKRSNQDFFAYYSLLGIAGSAQSWEACYGLFQEDLPVCFRITSCKSPLGARMGPALVHAFLHAIGVKVEPAAYHNTAEAPRCLLFNCLASTAGLDVLQDLGLIYRQEQNSALPALLLDVGAGHRVLDMCAAPGSKTLQVLDLMLADANGVFPQGMLVANDKDRERASVVARRTRMHLRQALLITNSDAKHYPTIRRRKQQLKMRFDRVLCDVPCSSDGTLRKSKHQDQKTSLWKTWGAWMGLGLHKTQVAILRRGLELLGPGGRLVYSTCSLNPVENEAVVAAVLEGAVEGSLRLLPLPAVPGLDAEPGLQTWRVPDPAFSAEKPVLYASFEEAEASRTASEALSGKKSRNILLPSMFPTTHSLALEQLPFCARILPMHCNGGGFFVAVFEKFRVVKVGIAAADCNAEAADEVEEVVEDGQQVAEEIREVQIMEEGDVALSVKVEATHAEKEADVQQIASATGSSVPQSEQAVVKPPSELKPLVRTLPEPVGKEFMEEFGLSPETFPQASVFLRGESMVVASRELAKIWCTNKSVQVMNSGQYLFSNVSGPFEDWVLFPEAAQFLGSAASQRRLDLTMQALDLLLRGAEEERAVPLKALRDVGAAGWCGSLRPGPVVLGVRLSPQAAQEIVQGDANTSGSGTTVGFLAAHMEESAALAIVEGARWTAKRWLTVLQKLEYAVHPKLVPPPC